MREEAYFNIDEMQLQRGRHGSVKLQEEITSFPKFEPLNIHLFLDFLKHH